MCLKCAKHEKILNEIERKKILPKKIASVFKPKMHSFQFTCSLMCRFHRLERAKFLKKASFFQFFFEESDVSVFETIFNLKFNYGIICILFDEYVGALAFYFCKFRILCKIPV